ncbi:hypothetical protein DSO57_1027875 [Entomophthora muscae]|uniref:Uncharacterized protein n=1 Tax=Entomophthora muscae TaxID=34485 RepID=A0ACC2U040_9FUNG|nr:hypothetical protein DSO57_1027875 [Entomophthora muscae]
MVLMSLDSYFPRLSAESSLWMPLQAATPVLPWIVFWWILLPGWESNLVSLASPLSQRDLADQVIDIQATAYSAAFKTEILDLSLFNVSHSPVSGFQLGDQVLYYQNCVGGCAHKLDFLRVGLLTVTFKCGSEYTGIHLLEFMPNVLCAYRPAAPNLGGICCEPDFTNSLAQDEQHNMKGLPKLGPRSVIESPAPLPAVCRIGDSANDTTIDLLGI